ncbi:MAG: LCP family protein [Baekduia sp.]
MSEQSPEHAPARPAREMLKRALLAALVVVFCSATTVATAALLELDSLVDAFNSESRGPGFDTGVLDRVDPGGPQTILLLGADKRWGGVNKGDPVRSDTMMLVRLDPDRGATAVLSIPRDLKVKIPGHGTDKINAAMAIGGPALAVRTVRELLGIPISHVVTVNFRGFRRAVNRLGCIYTDVDRKYFNDNAPPFGGGPNYAVIDVEAGYQKLCGQDALDYVRYRHFDNDVIRAARQQQFLTDARNQIGVSDLFDDRKELLKIFGAYTQTDIRDSDAILRLMKLVVDSAEQPVQEIQFEGEIGPSYVTVSKEKLDALVERFKNAEGEPRKVTPSSQRRTARKRSARKASRARSTPSAQGRGLTRNPRPAEDVAIALAPEARFPIFYPRVMVSGSGYLPDHSRAYTIRDRGNRKHRAYRIVVRTGELGQYYGIQGTTWDAPPILDSPSRSRKSGGRTYDIYEDGGRIRLVAWRSSGARYWVSNTLLYSLSNAQMQAIARSVSRIN